MGQGKGRRTHLEVRQALRTARIRRKKRGGNHKKSQPSRPNIWTQTERRRNGEVARGFVDRMSCRSGPALFMLVLLLSGGSVGGGKDGSR